MGMDLKPIKLRNEWGDGEPMWHRYNAWAWVYLNRLIQEFKLRPLRQTNDGYLVTEKKYKKIAEILLANKERLADDQMDHLIEDAKWWKNCGGCRVY